MKIQDIIVVGILIALVILAVRIRKGRGGCCGSGGCSGCAGCSGCHGNTNGGCAACHKEIKEK